MGTALALGCVVRYRLRQLSFARLRAEQRRPHEARRVRVEGTRCAVERETVLVRELALQHRLRHRRALPRDGRARRARRRHGRRAVAPPRVAEVVEDGRVELLDEGQRGGRQLRGRRRRRARLLGYGELGQLDGRVTVPGSGLLLRTRL